MSENWRLISPRTNAEKMHVVPLLGIAAGVCFLALGCAGSSDGPGSDAVSKSVKQSDEFREGYQSGYVMGHNMGGVQRKMEAGGLSYVAEYEGALRSYEEPRDQMISSLGEDHPNSMRLSGISAGLKDGWADGTAGTFNDGNSNFDDAEAIRRQLNSLE